MIEITATHFRRTLTEEEKDAFAYEVALGYFEPEELRKIFKLLPEGFNQYMASDEMATRIALKKREIDESPNALRILARRAARKAVEANAKLVEDPDAPAKTRMEAGRQLREFAVVADRESLAKGDADEGAVIIRTNLDMGNAKGVYTITAAEIEEQEAENAELSKEAGAVLEDDFTELLGL